MRCFHGTTEENLRILLNGGREPVSCWDCSNRDEKLYVHVYQKYIKVGEIHRSDGIEYNTNFLVSRAFESAQIQAAFQAKSQKMYVLQLNLRGVESLEDDNSCENMKEIASCIDSSDFKVSQIQAIYVAEFNQWHAPFIIADMMSNDYFNSSAIDDEALLEMSSQLSRIKSYMEIGDTIREIDFYQGIKDKVLSELRINQFGRI